MKIIITEAAVLAHDNDISLDIFNKFGDVTVYENITRADLLKEAKDADVILCNKALIDEELISVAENLKYIGTFATGYNNIDLDAAAKKGIMVCNAAGYSTNAVAQQVIAYTLEHFTKISKYNDFVKNGGWKEATLFSPLVFKTDEVFGKTFGIIGFGSIGKAVAKIATVLGFKVLVYTRTVKDDTDVEFTTLENLLSNSDVVSLHCPLNEQSRDMMNSDTFSKMKKGAFFINTSRGGTVDEDALLNALESGHLSGAAVDVLKSEPMSKDCVLFNAPNIIITPHSAWTPVATRKRLVSLVAENLEKFLKGEPVDNLAG